MPTYEFRCPEGHDFEKFYRSISRAEAHPACPVCGQPAERVLSPTGFAFKGSGFYLTDYGKNAHRASPPAEKAGAGSESSGGGAESNPAAKAEGGAADGKKESSKPAESKPAPAAGPAAPKKKSAGE